MATLEKEIDTIEVIEQEEISKEELCKTLCENVMEGLLEGYEELKAKNPEKVKDFEPKMKELKKQIMESQKQIREKLEKAYSA